MTHQSRVALARPAGSCWEAEGEAAHLLCSGCMKGAVRAQTMKAVPLFAQSILCHAGTSQSWRGWGRCAQ